MKNKMHTPVFLQTVLEALAVRPDGKYIDGTAGEGGHLGKIAEQGATVLGIDYDRDQIERLITGGFGNKVTLVHGNFRDIARIAQTHGFTAVDGILLDLGLSYRQLRDKGIGLSYRNADEPLLMRLYDDNGTTAAQVLNHESAGDLIRMLVKNAEEPYAAEIVEEVLIRRRQAPLKTVGDLLEIITSVSRRNRVNAEATAARVFQALRMRVNEEMENLECAMHDAVELLRPGGRLVVITFHSLEDRYVKLFGKNTPGLKAIRFQVRSKDRARFERSAQLRVFEKQK
ncbi:MAG: 16S rRNA (cytosine(1402)-N(4))-methyltransferase RsmH [Patescibacteria group bacterium]|nr:16S rRNA (cytosine(1402)-N(4))-methyltransferase RsmH [Patescibacteria group bacterium]